MESKNKNVLIAFFFAFYIKLCKVNKSNIFFQFTLFFSSPDVLCTNVYLIFQFSF